MRLSSEMAFFNLADFNSNQAYLQYHFAQLQAATPSDMYRVSASSPTNAIVLEINPFYRPAPDLEIGLDFKYWAFSPFVLDVGDIHPDYFHDYQRNLNCFEFDALGRFYFWKSNNEGIRLFMEAGAGIQPISAGLQENYANTDNNPSSDFVGDNVSAIGFNTGLKLGAAVDVGGGFLLSFKGGYEYSYASGFNGTWYDSGVEAKNDIPGSLMVVNDPASGLNYLQFIPSSSSNQALFGITPAMLANSRPLVADLSGLRLSVDISYDY